VRECHPKRRCLFRPYPGRVAYTVCIVERSSDLDIGLGTVLAVAMFAVAIRRRSWRLLALSATAAIAEVAYRQWLAHSRSETARRIRDARATTTVAAP